MNSLCTLRGPQAPEQGKHVPEVGLELHSGPCNHWEVRENIRQSEPVRPMYDPVRSQKCGHCPHLLLATIPAPKGTSQGFSPCDETCVIGEGHPCWAASSYCLGFGQGCGADPGGRRFAGFPAVRTQMGRLYSLHSANQWPIHPPADQVNVFSAQRSGSVVSPLLFRRVLGHPRQTRVGASGRANMTHRPHSRHGQSRAGAFEASATATLRLWPRRATRECGLTTYMGGDFHRRR